MEGFVYGATSLNGKWQQRFHRWPKDRNAIVEWVLSEKDNRNVYLAPSMFNSPSSLKEHWGATNMVWAEIDGSYPEFKKTGLPTPTIVIQSGLPNHQHVYWRVERTEDCTPIEAINRQLAYMLKADSSGYDCNQVLRPPDTWNFKRNLPVLPVVVNGAATPLPLEFFSQYDPAPKLMVVPDLTEDGLIPVEQIIEKYFTPETLQKAIARCSIPNERSTGLMHLGYLSAEMGMETDEMMSLLFYVDGIIKKFHGRSDQWVRLQEIVTIAKQKHPHPVSIKIIMDEDEPEEDENPFQAVDIRTLATQEIHINWLWDHFLGERGLMLISGAPAVGKSQFTLDAMCHLALGEEFMGVPMKEGVRTGFLSLEMGDVSIHSVVQKQLTQWDSAQQEKLADHVMIYPLGEPLDLTNPKNQAALAKQIKKDKLDGIAIDALSSTTLEALSDEKAAKAVLGWFAHLRQSLGVFVWIVHHNRKATAGNERPNRLADVHGAVYIAGQADSILVLWKDEKGQLEMIPVKTRLSGYDDGSHILQLTRRPNLTFSHLDKKPDPVKPKGVGPDGNILL